MYMSLSKILEWLKEFIFIVASVEPDQQYNERVQGTESELPKQQLPQKSWIPDLYTESKIPKEIEEIRKNRQNLSKKLKVKTYETIILQVVLYGCETWSLTLWEGHRLKVLE